MIAEGQIVLFRFPHTDQDGGKLRPALVLRRLPGRYQDWLICMISSQIEQRLPDLDETLDQTAPDFPHSGLKHPSVIRITRLAVASESIFMGTLGHIESSRLDTIRQKLANWLLAARL